MATVIIIGVVVVSAFVGWLMWHTCQEAERAQRDPRYRRRIMVWLGLIYAAGALFGTVEVITRREPIQSLIGLPIGLALAWVFLREATSVKVPPT